MKNFGKYIIFISTLFLRRESFKTYFNLSVKECIKIGYESLFIVAIVSIFMGAVTTLQTAFNLVGPLIPDYVISLVVRDMTLLELSPTIIAIVFAGKVGSNIAGELGTMRITEQIDALEVMGINSSSYLVLPKIIASILMYPILVVMSAFLAILGGYIAGTISEVIAGTEYIYGLRYEFNPFNIPFALISAKSAVLSLKVILPPSAFNSISPSISNIRLALVSPESFAVFKVVTALFSTLN